jgi:hypothetical protein
VFAKLAWPLRIFAALGGLLYAISRLVTDLIGFAIVGGIVLYQYFRAKALPSTPLAHRQT